MAEGLLSVGLDVGTTSTQLIVSELTVENRASSFAVPEMEITRRNIRYKSPVHFTPLLDESRVDGQRLRQLVEAEYVAAGIHRADVDTGAVIITGETSRKENARAVLDAMSDFAGDFVVATAGPDLESVLAARGAGAVQYSQETGKSVLHMDIGGGTSNLALMEEGRITATGCLNVGGRLIKFDKNCRITYISPVLRDLCQLSVGDIATPEKLEPVARMLTQALEMASGLREPTQLLDDLTTEATQRLPLWGSGTHSVTFGDSSPNGRANSQVSGVADVLSFSGGVADCIGQQMPWQQFGDMGPILGQSIRRSRLCQGVYRLGEETIRATVIGAGCHSAQLSGSTVFYQGIAFPLKNLPVATLTVAQQQAGAEELAARIRAALARLEGEGAVLALPGIAAPHYEQVTALAEGIAQGFTGRPVIVALEQDMAKALGQALALRAGENARILCLDRVKLTEGSYLDVGAPIGPAMPVVVKTLVLGR